MPKSPQQRAALRCCASCEWIYKGGSCPKCGFASYGARYVYGDACYRYARTQEPWFRKKLSSFTCKLYDEIRNATKPNLTRWNLKPLAVALQKRYNIGCPDMVGFSAAIDQAVADGFDSESVQTVLDWLGKRESFDKFFPSFKRPDLLREKLCDIAAKRQERIAELDALGD